MALETQTDVNRLTRVDDEEGDPQPPANTEQQRATNRRLGNHDSLEAFAFEPSGSDAVALPSRDVPEGVTVLVMALDSNDAGSRVYVGGADAQPAPLKPEAAVKSNVTDTAAIHVRAPTAGDGVAVLYEADS